MTQISEFRLESLLECLIAKVRPDPSFRDRCDVGYRMVDNAFIIDITTPVSEDRSVPRPFLKAVSLDEGSTWRLFEQQDGQWVVARQGALMGVNEVLQVIEPLVAQVLCIEH